VPRIRPFAQRRRAIRATSVASFYHSRGHNGINVIEKLFFNQYSAVKRLKMKRF